MTRFPPGRCLDVTDMAAAGTLSSVQHTATRPKGPRGPGRKDAEGIPLAASFFPRSVNPLVEYSRAGQAGQAQARCASTLRGVRALSPRPQNDPATTASSPASRWPTGRPSGSANTHEIIEPCPHRDRHYSPGRNWQVVSGASLVTRSPRPVAVAEHDQPDAAGPLPWQCRGNAVLWHARLN